MESETYVSPLLATLAIAAVFTVLFTILVAELPAAARLRQLLQLHVQKPMALIAATATASSLYYSEVAGFTPCDFCWYQRIIMYPLAIILLVAVFTRDRLRARYIVALAFIGLGLSIYHYQLQTFPEQGKVCSATVSCTAKFVNQFGFVSIPFMAGCGFLSILLLQVAAWRARRVDELLAEEAQGEPVRPPAPGGRAARARG